MEDTRGTTNQLAAIATPHRRRLRFGLRTLLIFVAIAGCALGWLGVKVREARRQEADVAARLKLGGSAENDYDEDGQGNRVQKPGPPPWLRAVLGDDFFRDIIGTELNETPATDADLEHLRRVCENQMVASRRHADHRCRLGLRQRVDPTRNPQPCPHAD